MATAVNATKLGIAKFVVPYIFAFSPILLLVGDNVTLPAVLLNTCTALVGVFGLQCALTNTLFHRHVNPLIRIVLAAGGLGMMIPGTLSDLVGLAVIVLMCGVQWLLAKRTRKDDEGAGPGSDLGSGAGAGASADLGAGAGSQDEELAEARV